MDRVELNRVLTFISSSSHEENRVVPRTAEFPTVPFLHLYHTDCMLIAGFWLPLLSIYFRISSVLLHVLCSGTYSAYLFFLKSLLLTCVVCVSDICLESLLGTLLCVFPEAHMNPFHIYMHMCIYVHMIQIHDKNTYLLQH